MTPSELEKAVAELFRLNNYEVVGPLQIDGASVDLKATPLGDPFAKPIFIEVTVEYVDVTKFGKDLTKYVACSRESPGSPFIVISSTGFTQSVIERAGAEITCLTYEQLLSRFEKFFPFQRAVLDEGGLAEHLSRLADVYEEPNFEVDVGLEPALTSLHEWVNDDHGPGWLIVVGEYGTGKTALTQMMLRQLMEKHRIDPSRPIPVRIELRDFTKQFDVASLLHKFLDDNGLGHVPIQFFQQLISRGRVILLLDGYDEMAQYMHLLERRVCLEALAQLSRDGARGLLTSRPNYFSEAEELHVLETLYNSLSDAGVMRLNDYASEAALDSLFESQFIERNERRLQDLDEAQTETLVRARLSQDPSRADVVLKLLAKVSRPTDDGARPLGGKPVIISYLVELADSLAERSEVHEDTADVTEYSCFRLIVDSLMARDRHRSPSMPPDARRGFLHRMAMRLSQADMAVFREDDFMSLISEIFQARLDRLPPSERESERQTLFADLRSSATLTRVTSNAGEGWRFSHNSLREFLVVEYLLKCLFERKEPAV